MRGRKVFFLIMILVCACKAKNEEVFVKPDNVESIKVNLSEKTAIIPFEEVFDSMRLVPLETTEESLIGTIGRITIYKNNIYILNKQSQSIVVFDINGKFLRKIQRIGGGEGEYYQLMDFTIDYDRDHLIVHADRPGALYVYDLEGNFIERENLPTFYKNILYSDGKLLLLNQRAELLYRSFIRDVETDEESHFLAINDVDKIFENFAMGAPYAGFYPYAIKSGSPYFFFPHIDTIYQFTNGSVSAKYNIDFGGHSIPKGFFSNKRSASENFQLALKEGYGSFIANFRDSKNYICFSFGGGLCTIVVYSKHTKKSKVFQAAQNKKNFIFFQSLLAHDSDVDDDLLIGIYEAMDFKELTDMLKFDYIPNPDIWKTMPDDLKALDSLIDINSNPILVMCTLKEESDGLEMNKDRH